MEHKISNELPPLPSESMTTDTPPSPEQQSGELVAERQGAQAIETGASQAADDSSQQQIPQATTAQPSMPQAQMPTDQPPVDPQTPIIADDNDLIEKEWVLKAKEIVARTKHDPYMQNKEVERIKADYMKKRYNKDVKVTED
jgi:hypothetical protein